MKSKRWWLDLAEVLDAHRLIPKVFVIAYASFYAVLLWDVWQWIKGMIEMDLEPMDIVALAGIPGIVISALGGILGTITKKYFETGRKWNGPVGGE